MNEISLLVGVVIEQLRQVWQLIVLDRVVDWDAISRWWLLTVDVLEVAAWLTILIVKRLASLVIALSWWGAYSWSTVIIL